jgi:putative flippase GtrA
MIKKIYNNHQEKVHFLLAGGFNTAFGYFVFITLFYLLKNTLHYQAILALAYFIGFNCSFLTFKCFVFKSNKKWLKEYIKTFISATVIYFVNAISLYIFVEIFKISVIFAQALSIIITTISSYLLHKNFSFKQ